MDRLSGTSASASTQDPLRLLIRDAGVLIKTLPYLPLLIIPFRTSNNQAELYLSWEGSRDILLQSWLFLTELVFLLFAPAAVFLLPGGLLLLIVGLACFLNYLVSWPMQGERIIHSKIADDSITSVRKYEHERWLFINGCMTGHRGLQLNINRLSMTFGRPVTGIHNQTYGIIADLLECLVQRCFAFKTMDVRVAYDHTKACLIDPAVSKVVLIAHSQGGIIASLVLDCLYADLPCDIVSKLEVYTFGSAASHFSDPHLSNSSFSANYCIPHIEHYVNELDLVPRWGVLYNVCHIFNNRYCGKVFVRMGASGHLFNQHYMDPIFPQEHELVGAFLDQVLEVDEKLAVCRERETQQQVVKMRKMSGGQTPIHDENVDDLGNKIGEMLNGYRPSGAMLINFVEPNVAEKARGKTVRQISRLWKYTDGGSPRD